MPELNTTPWYRPVKEGAELDRLLAYWREFQNMVAASPMWLPSGMREAQAESWGRANVATGDPRFD